MLSIAHAATGAFIATKIHNPYLSVPLILASHFLEDFIPHWDVGQGLTKKIKSYKDAFIQELLTDFPASILIVFFFFQYGQPFSIYPWLGWFIALLPDFLEFPYLFLNWRFTPIKQFGIFHKFWHHSVPDKVRGLLPQVLVLALIYIFK